jgi:hypothetical protein
MNIKKNNISLLSSLFDSYLIDKDSRFLSIAYGLTDSIRKVYGAATPPLPSANFDAVLNASGQDTLKTSYGDIYNGIKFLLDYKITTATTSQDLIKIGTGQSGTNAPIKTPKIPPNKYLYAALLIAKYIKNDTAILNSKTFQNNNMLSF